MDDWSTAEPPPRFSHHQGPEYREALRSVALTPVGKAKIPPRPWAYGHYLLFGQAAVLGAVDGGGKGAMAVVMALARITGRPLLGEKVWRTGPVMIVSYEDDNDEWHRRIAAACDHYEIDYAFALANIRFLVRPNHRIVFATMLSGEPGYPDSEDIIHAMREFGAGLLIVDPLNHAHGFDDGNNNVALAKVAAAMNNIAAQTHAAILVLHHLRKGSTGVADDLMGATSLRATFRSCRILARMTTDEAEKLGVKDGAWRYSRISGSKDNYAPPRDKAAWFRLASVDLGNATSDYPEGDNVQVCTAWQCRPTLHGLDAEKLAVVFTELREHVHGPSKQARHTPWAGKPLMEIGGRSEIEATKIVKLWITNGVLIEGEHYHQPSKNTVKRVTLDKAKAAEILAPIRWSPE